LKLVNGKLEKRTGAAGPGIGISNLQKRLELLYPGRHTISIADDGEVFIVNLKLVLEPATESNVHTLLKAGRTHA
jgi:LytS/YehU family sensor histidine kinase